MTRGSFQTRKDSRGWDITDKQIVEMCYKTICFMLFLRYLARKMGEKSLSATFLLEL